MKAFTGMDRNGDGQLEHDELKVVLKSIGPHLTDEDMEEWISDFMKADTDHDGKISYAEFVRYMTNCH